MGSLFNKIKFNIILIFFLTKKVYTDKLDDPIQMKIMMCCLFEIKQKK